MIVRLDQMTMMGFKNPEKNIRLLPYNTNFYTGFRVKRYFFYTAQFFFPNFQKTYIKNMYIRQKTYKNYREKAV